MITTVNAGEIDADHWTHDRKIGGGRILGEVCHFVDLLRYLTGASIKEASLQSMQESKGDTVSLNLEFGDGSIGTVHYFANGHRKLKKERLDVFCEGKVFQLDNFIKLSGYGWPGFSNRRLWRQDKGQFACAKEFLKVDSQQSKSPISFSELIEVQKTLLNLIDK